MKPVLAAFLVALSSACALGGAAPAQGARATLVVENQSTFELTIYAVRGTQRMRLGQARSLATTELEIPSSHAFGAQLRFEAQPIGSRRAPISQEITVWPGDRIVMRIPSLN